MQQQTTMGATAKKKRRRRKFNKLRGGKKKEAERGKDERRRRNLLFQLEQKECVGSGNGSILEAAKVDLAPCKHIRLHIVNFEGVN